MEETAGHLQILIQLSVLKTEIQKLLTVLL